METVTSIHPPIEPNALTCPHCQAEMQGYLTTCPQCGSDLNWLTLLAEGEAWAHATPAKNEARPPASLESLIPRLGDFLVWNGYITPEQLQKALSAQAAQAADAGGPRHLLGRTLVKLGYLNEDVLDRVIAEQIFELQQALLQANRDLERRVTERTAELETALNRLAEFNQLKANLVANISHELRTPLTHIKGYNALMRQGDLGPVSEDQATALEVTGRSIERLEQLISDLISFSAAAKGELSLKMKPIHPAQVVQYVVRGADAKARQRQVKLLYQLSPELPPIVADEEKLSWTLSQLVDNGLKFTPTNGTVTLSAIAEDPGVRFLVQDTGIGIPAERLDEIFEPFRQLDSSPSRRYGGTGLGLTLARRIVEAHGAALKVTSEVGHGSDFTFLLPRAPAADPVSA